MTDKTIMNPCIECGGNCCRAQIEGKKCEAMLYGKIEQEWHPLKWKDEETKCKILDYPYDGKWVIVTDGKNISVERIKIDAIDHFYPAGRWFELEDVIAWMLLPEPYKGEGEANEQTTD